VARLSLGTQDLALARQALSFEPQSQPLFASVIFQIGSHVFAWDSLDCNLPTSAFHAVGVTGEH
jgi:hypothetical protein